MCVGVFVSVLWRGIENIRLLWVHGELPGMRLQIISILLLSSAVNPSSYSSSLKELIYSSLLFCICVSVFFSVFHLFHLALKSDDFTLF